MMLSRWLLILIASEFLLAGVAAAVNGLWWLTLYCICASLIQLSVMGGMR